MQGQRAIQSGERVLIATSSALDFTELTANGRASSWLMARPELKELKQSVLGYWRRALAVEELPHMQNTRARSSMLAIAASPAQ